MKAPTYIELIEQALNSAADALAQIDQAKSVLPECDVQEEIAGSANALSDSAVNLIRDAKQALFKVKELHDEAVENKNKQPAEDGEAAA